MSSYNRGRRGRSEERLNHGRDQQAVDVISGALYELGGEDKKSDLVVSAGNPETGWFMIAGRFNTLRATPAEIIAMLTDRVLTSIATRDTLPTSGQADRRSEGG